MHKNIYTHQTLVNLLHVSTCPRCHFQEVLLATIVMLAEMEFIFAKFIEFLCYFMYQQQYLTVRYNDCDDILRCG